MSEHETFDMMAGHVRTIATEMITEEFGPRCSGYEESCEICRRWWLLDSLLGPKGLRHPDEPTDELQERVAELKAIVDSIEELRRDDYIIIHSGTESGYKPEYESVEVAAEWTNGETEWFHGDTLADALKAAIEAKAEREAS